MDTPREVAIERLRTTLDLFDAGCAIKRAALRRRHPGLDPDEEDRLLGEWLHDKDLTLSRVPGFRLRRDDS